MSDRFLIPLDMQSKPSFGNTPYELSGHKTGGKGLVSEKISHLAIWPFFRVF